MDKKIDYCDSFFLTDVEKQSIEDLSVTKTLKKGSIILEEGKVSTECYLILKGCARQYYLVDGEEKTTFFYTEQQSITSTVRASKNFIACVEDCTFSVMTSANEKILYKRHPRIETLCRLGLEEMLREYQEMFATYMVSSPEDRYLNLLETRPDLLNRVPQYQLASYLGVKPESLSRIRKRLSLKTSKL